MTRGIDLDFVHRELAHRRLPLGCDAGSVARRLMAPQ
jgi:hypothetical protein